MILAGWLDVQSIVIPGTAGMRTHAAKAIEQISTLMPENVLAAWRARGATMSAIHLVQFLQAQLGQSEAELTHERN